MSDYHCKQREGQRIREQNAAVEAQKEAERQAQNSTSTGGGGFCIAEMIQNPENPSGPAVWVCMPPSEIEEHFADSYVWIRTPDGSSKMVTVREAEKNGW